MMWIKMLMEKLAHVLFDPEEEKWVHWLLYPVGSMLLVLAALFFRLFPPAGLVALFAGFSFVVFWFASSKWRFLAAFSFSLFLMVLSVSSESMQDSWYRLWSLSTVVTAIIAAVVLPKVKESFHGSLAKHQSEMHEKQLWMTRFETLKNRSEEEKEMLALEIEKAHEEKNSEKLKLSSLRKLLEIAKIESAEFAKEKNVLTKEKEALIKEIDSLKEESTAFERESHDKEISSDQPLLADDKMIDLDEGRYTKEEIFSMLRQMSSFDEQKALLDTVIEELQSVLEGSKVPFKWQEWNAERAPERPRQQIKLGDLAKTLK